MNQDSSKDYFPSVDCLKGILIILVIVGHILPGSLRENPWRYSIYSFHMPLFLGVSGFLLKRSSLRSQSMGHLFRKYLHSMMLPWFVAFLCFNVVVLTGKEDISVKELCFLFLYPYFHLWFIPVLFGMIILTFLIERFKIEYIWGLGVSFLFTLLWETLYFQNPIWGGPEILKWLGDKRLYLYFVFFFVGYTLRNSADVILKKWHIGYFIFFASLLLICRIFNFFFYYPELPSVLVWLLLNIILIYVFTYSVNKISFPCRKILSFLGVYSLPIYLWHVFPIMIMQRLNIDRNYLTSFYCLAIVSQVCLFVLIRKLENEKAAKLFLIGYRKRELLRSTG